MSKFSGMGWNMLEPPISSKLAEIGRWFPSSRKKEHLSNYLCAGFGKYILLPEISNAVLPDSGIDNLGFSFPITSVRHEAPLRFLENGLDEEALSQDQAPNVPNSPGVLGPFLFCGLAHLRRIGWPGMCIHAYIMSILSLLQDFGAFPSHGGTPKSFKILQWDCP